MRRLALLCLLAFAAPAGAAAPPAEVDALRGGTAIVRYAGDRADFVSVLRRARIDAVVLRELPFAAVRGPRALLTRVARLPLVRGVRVDRRVFFEGSAGRAPAPFRWALDAAPQDGPAEPAYDGSGVNVAVVDTGTDGLTPT